MIKFEKHIPLSLGQSYGLFGVSTTNASYVECAYVTYRQIDVTAYSEATYYYEAVIQTSAGTGYATLWNHTGGAAVSGGEISTSSTSLVRVRSSAVTLTGSDDYTDRIKNNGSNTTTFYGGRVVVIQSASAISATESIAVLFSYSTNGTTSGSYVQPGSIGDIYWLYTAANWDGTVSIYHEVTMKVSAGTGYAEMQTTGGSSLSGSEVTTSSTSFVRVRSSAVSPADATAYKTMIKASGGTTSFNSSAVVIRQTGTPTKGEAYLPFNTTTAASATGGAFADHQARVYYDPANWSLDSISWYYETGSLSGGAFGSSRVYDIDAAGALTGASVSFTGSTTERLRSSAVTMPGAAHTLRAETNSAAGTHYMAVARLIAVMSWTNVSTSGGAFLLNFV